LPQLPESVIQNFLLHSTHTHKLFNQWNLAVVGMIICIAVYSGSYRIFYLGPVRLIDSKLWS